MKKILCPVDFREASRSGMEYAAHMARALNASLSLFYVRTSIWPEAIQLGPESERSQEDILSQLALSARAVKKEFGINCNYHTETTTDTLDATIALYAQAYDLIVMGTNGADDFYQYVFGSNSFQVIEKSKCPVLIIPEGSNYTPLQTVVYAYDPEINPIFLIEQLKKLILPLGPSVKVLHISENEPSPVISHKIEVLEAAVKAREPRNVPWSFDCKYANDVPWALDHYMKEKKADMLALSFHHRRMMEKLFGKNVVRQLSMVAEYPVFVFWH